MTGADLLDAIERGILDPNVRAAAAALLADTAPKALANEHTRSSPVRASDAGRCTLELWAELHGMLDLAIDVETQLTRFDLGTLYGAWLGAILKVELEREDRYRVVLEHELTREGVVGHADVLVYGHPHVTPIIVAEIKSTYSPSLDSPTSLDKKGQMRRPYQVAQVVHYALAGGFPAATVLTVAPAAFRAPQRMRADDYDPAEWRNAVDLEYARLSRASDDAAPEGDPAQEWRCESCRFSACVLNRNPLARQIA